MEKVYALWERISADTPSFFKKAQLLGLALAGLGTSLTQVQAIPSKITTVLISAGSAIAIIAQFAIKIDQPSNTQNNAIK